MYEFIELSCMQELFYNTLFQNLVSAITHKVYYPHVVTYIRIMLYKYVIMCYGLVSQARHALPLAGSYAEIAIRVIQ